MTEIVSPVLGLITKFTYGAWKQHCSMAVIKFVCILLLSVDSLIDLV
jgi:hypothetical protein